uniref:Uncharacterized protein n=2 Tax=Corethron hystrix TaxID=216773 RepID=A0A7S1C087_9STRA|mmetsp:Transcript_8845/g.19490  ORF Transcript_8845/g.19490 Transcript_8845/m.19490 type:complete len:122 (+) Transcript_8845:467-832(+)
MEAAVKESRLDNRLAIISSVIERLASSEDFSSSHALASALATRAEIRLSASSSNANGAAEDCRRACRAFPHQRALRLLARAEEMAGNYSAALEATQKWDTSTPSDELKLKSEIERLKNIIG